MQAMPVLTLGAHSSWLQVSVDGTSGELMMRTGSDVGRP